MNGLMLELKEDYIDCEMSEGDFLLVPVDHRHVSEFLAELHYSEDRDQFRYTIVKRPCACDAQILRSGLG